VDPDISRAQPRAPYIDGMMPPVPSSESSTPGRCPICRKPAVERFRPFCSQRCKDVDLNRWLSGVYAVPAVEAEDEDLEVEPPAPAPPRER
jgi:endogenous inhibitor of DNA gyrase (YacG/DUF329 family)